MSVNDADVKRLLTAYYSCKHQKVDFDEQIIGNPGLLLELPDESTIQQCMSALDSMEIFMYNDLIDDIIDFILKMESEEVAEALTPAFTRRKTTRNAKLIQPSDLPDEVTFDEMQFLPHSSKELEPRATVAGIAKPCPSTGSRKRRLESTVISIPEELEPAENIELVQQTPVGASTPQQNYLAQFTIQYQAEPDPLRQNESQIANFIDSLENIQLPSTVPHSTPIISHTPGVITSNTGINEELHIRALPLASSAVNLAITEEDFIDDSLMKEFEEMFQNRPRRTEAMQIIDDDHVVVTPKRVTYLHRHYERGILPAKLATTYENYNFFPELESYDINDEINLFIVNTITVPPFKRPLNTRTESVRIQSYRAPIEPIREIASETMDSFGSAAVKLPNNNLPNLTDSDKLEQAQMYSRSQIIVEPLEGDVLIPQMTVPHLPPSSPLPSAEGGGRFDVLAVVHRTNSEEELPSLSGRQIPEQEIQRILSADQVMRETSLQDHFTPPVIHHPIVPPEEVILGAETNEQINVQVDPEDRNWFSILRERDGTDIQYYEPGQLGSRPRRKRARRILAEMEAEMPGTVEAEIPFDNIPIEDAPIEDNNFRIEFEEWKNMVLKNVQSDKFVPFTEEISNISDTTNVGKAMSDVFQMILERKFVHKFDLIPNTLPKKEAILRLKILFELQAQKIINIESNGTELEKIWLQE